MAKKSYVFEEGGPKRLEVSWKGNYYVDTTVSLDGNVLGVIPDQRALKNGQEYRLIDGSVIRVQLIKKFYATELHVLRNGQPLPGSASDPVALLKNACIMVYLIAGLNLVLGLINVVFNVQFLRDFYGMGIGSVVYGLVFLVLGFFVQRRSNVALILAIALFALDAIAGMVLGAAQGYNPGIGGLFVRVALLIPMVQGVGAIKTLKMQSTRATVRP